jgi:hypothetical protein
MRSPAWKSLPPTARALYVELAKHYNGTNNGRVAYAVRDAADDLGIGSGTAGRMLLTLQQRGFIVATKKGAFSRKHRHATEWRLTQYPCDITNELPTKDFMRWQPNQNLEHGA